MFFNMPVLVYQEKECVVSHSKEIAALGKKAFIITGKVSSKKNGSLNDVVRALEQERIEYVIFDEIEENPSVETILKARDFGLNQKVDFVIGIGGGSPLDASKAIALMITNSLEGADFLYKKVNKKEALPVVAVPTTCGTGSETTPYAILTRHDKKTKASISHQIFPKIALVDGKYIQNMQQSVLVSTAIDALGHFIESYLNTKATPYNKMLCEYGLRIWGKSRDVIAGIRDAIPDDYQNLMLASSIAGMAISHTGTSLPHGMSYKVTYTLGIPHGTAVGVFLASYMEEADPKEVSQILQCIGFGAVAELRSYIKSVLINVEVDTGFLDEAVMEMISNERKLVNCPFKVDKALLREMYISSISVK